MQFLRFSGYTHVEVEANDNTPMMAQQVYKNTGVPFPVSHVRIYEGEPDGQLCAITGWASKDGGSPTTAYAVQIDDSSEGSAYLVYGGDYGVRLKACGVRRGVGHRFGGPVGRDSPGAFVRGRRDSRTLRTGKDEPVLRTSTRERKRAIPSG